MAPTLSFETYSNIIDGKLKDTANTLHGINPTNGEKLWPVPRATEFDLNEAVLAAIAAFPKWSRTTVEERKKTTGAFIDAYKSLEGDFAVLCSKETGKPAMLANGEATKVVSWGEANLSFELPETVAEDNDTVKVVTRYVPLGVVAAILPWNFPLLLCASKLFPAVLTGNTVIIKPSPYAPYSALKLVELAQSFFPPGVVQALSGDEELGPLMVKHPDIHKISFTGSIATGKRVMASAADTLKRVTLELGGNDASIICPDVDVAKVAQQVAIGAFQNAGQICAATKRIYVHSSIYPSFIQAMVGVASTFTPGGDFLPPVQNTMQYEKVKDIYADCLSHNYTFALGDGHVRPHASGFFCAPTIVANPPDKSRIVVEEPFGPIVPVMVWDDEEDVIARANDTDTGLGACVFSRDEERAERIAQRLEAGSVFVNNYEMARPTGFFSGHKQSGIGGEWGAMGLLGYCNAKTFYYYKPS